MAQRTSADAPGTNLKPVQVKLVLLGEAAVGKSSLVLRFVNGEFQDNKEPTIGAAFLTQKCKLEEKIIKFEIWDTAGQERFHSLAPMYYRNAQAAVVAYDITKAASLEKAKTWVKELQRQANPNIVIALVGNKLDLAVSREVETEAAQAYAAEENLLFLEASAKTGDNVVDVFTEIVLSMAIDVNTRFHCLFSQKFQMGSAAAESGLACIPDIYLGSSKAADALPCLPASEGFPLHAQYEGKTEAIWVGAEMTTQDLGRALLSLLGTRQQDLGSEAVVTLWTIDGQRVSGQPKANTASTPYTLKVSSGLNQPDPTEYLWKQVQRLANGLAERDMDRAAGDGASKPFVEQHTFTQQVKDDLKLPTFNNWDYSDSELVSLIMHIYVDLALPSHFSIEMQTLYNFVTTVKNHYNENPFHCFKHAFCVFQMAYALLQATQLVKTLSMLELLVLMTSCLGHDLDHPGRNNAYQINAKTELAVIYNNNAPLENHHSAMLLAILSLDSCNLLKGLDAAQLAAAKRGIVRVILATDMAKHGEHLTIFSKAVSNFSITDPEHRAQLLCILIKCADISTEVSCGRGDNAADIWVNRLLEEFFCQSDREKQEGLPFLPFMDRDKVTKPSAQVGFLSFVVIPLYEALGKLYPDIEPGFIQPIKRSLQFYKDSPTAK
ncbi:hypothetical protein HDU91_002343 [Kappamyces sp. JEL0680]|nr:hypothetical protein HDU91_002343 [Kappamyces sp. JEL0680]